MPADPSQGLREALASLGPYRQTLRLPGDPGGDPGEPAAVPCHQVQQPESLRQSIENLAARLGTDELPAVASLWCKYYDAAVTPGVLAAMVLAGIGLDVARQRTSMAFEAGLPKAICLPDLGGAVVLQQRWPGGCEAPAAFERATRDVSAFQRFVWRGLFAEHLEPLVQRVSQVVSVRPRVLWANIGNRCAYHYDQFARDPRTRQASDEDRRALLGSRAGVWSAGRNPLHEPVRYEWLAGPAGPLRAQVRKTCCLRDRLPGEQLCQTCPRLCAEQRVRTLASQEKA